MTIAMTARMTTEMTTATIMIIVHLLSPLVPGVTGLGVVVGVVRWVVVVDVW